MRTRRGEENFSRRTCLPWLYVREKLYRKRGLLLYYGWLTRMKAKFALRLINRNDFNDSEIKNE